MGVLGILKQIAWLFLVSAADAPWVGGLVPSPVVLLILVCIFSRRLSLCFSSEELDGHQLVVGSFLA